jgi:phosphatidylglycerol:prolipoprotein diacylglycerol transferase
MWPRLGPVPTYSVLYCASILSHFVVAWHIARRLGLRRRVWVGLSVCYLTGMTVGAKVLYDLGQGGLDLPALLSAKHYVSGGLWGGLLAYIGLGAPLALALSRDKRGALDLVALTIPVPWVLAKLACLFNGCCYGRPCSMPWAITFGDGARGAPAGTPIHPTQIYEILVVLCVLAVFRALRHRLWRGTMLLWFLIVYGLGRALTEVWRGDLQENMRVGPLSLSQLLCLVAAGASIGMLWFWHRHIRQGARDLG